MTFKEDRARKFLDAVAAHVIVYDGAMGTRIQQYDLNADDFGGMQYNGCNDYLCVTRPDIIEEIHRSYLAAGADVIETDTFRSNRLTLGEYKLAERVSEINITAARLARRVADSFATPDKPRYVAGSIGPSGKLPSSTDPVLSNVTYNELVDVFREQAAALLQGGVDILLVETSQDILEVKAVIEGLKRAMADTGIRAAIQAQVTLDTNGKMLLGTDVGAALTIIESLGVDIVGLNCSTGPDYMRDPVRYLTSHTNLPVSAIPNAGMPLNVDGQAVYPMQPVPMAEMLSQFVHEFGCNIVGGCCGTTAEHISQIYQRVQGSNPWQVRTADLDTRPRAASAMRAVALDQEPKPLLVGERVNSQGSRKVKQLLLENNYDAILDIARDQADNGAHVLDVCVALTERNDEAEQMRHLVKLLSMSVETPLVIDSTDAAVIKAALETLPGRAIINSINMENGRKRIEDVLPLAHQHGAAVVALTIDEEGMAHTSERKLAIAQRMFDIATHEYGLPPGALIFDVLTFPVTTGQSELRRSAVETLEGIRKVKDALPGVYTLLGVSNVSFGLQPSARAAINSVFLHHAVQFGLDMAIVNPSQITPYAEIPVDQRNLIDDLIFDRSEDALAKVIGFYEQKGKQQSSDDKAGSRADPTENMTVEQKLHWHILFRKKEGVEALIDAAIASHDPVWVLNNVLLPAMKEVGDKFGAGELILPFVLQSAEVMKKSVARLETYLEKKAGAAKGTVVLATVFGDVHDIGKNLVGTILSNNGYEVIDLGKQVPVNTIIDAALQHNAAAIGLSALLVSTSKQMPICVQELYQRGIGIPVLIGGAAINRRFGNRILFMEDGQAYPPGVFYCKDAFEGLSNMDHLTGEERVNFISTHNEEAKNALLRDREREQAAKLAAERNGNNTRKSAKRLPSADAPSAPFLGARVIEREEIDIHQVIRLFDLNTLFRLHWGGKNRQGKAWEELVATLFNPTLQRFEEELAQTRWLSYGSVYGYFRVASQDDDLLVFDSQDTKRVIARWTFPRQPDEMGGGQHLCLGDYYRTQSEGGDIAAIQAVTAGPQATRRIEQLQAEGNYTEAYYLNGFADSLAEGLAEWTHRRIRRELGLSINQGLRYSWGYPACPDLSQQVDVLRLLRAEQVGIRLTEGHQLLPEQSTAAIIVHHPSAVYYTTGIERRQQDAAIREVLGDPSI
ncbi:MAG: methionine synthase [Chloroflexi bacterium]|nr:methionine synthase [Chloroflexota bacterium]MCL5273807.1 methionine synthase [Chloroflexota bacterium]